VRRGAKIFIGLMFIALGLLLIGPVIGQLFGILPGMDP